MKKDSYYFPHFYNARSDRKMLRVRRELGIEGYAIYFMLLEILREQTDFSYPLSDVDLLADEFRTSEQKIITVISSYDLFQVTEDKFFYSQKLIANLQPYLEKSERARLAARKRWDKSKKIDANALPEQTKCNASQNTKREEERKGEEKNKKFDFKNSLLGLGISKDIIEDWLSVRRTRKATNTETAFNTISNQIEKSSLTPTDCIRLAIIKDWKGFNWSWVKKEDIDLIQPEKESDENKITNEDLEKMYAKN